MDVEDKLVIGSSIVYYRDSNKQLNSKHVFYSTVSTNKVVRSCHCFFKGYLYGFHVTKLK